MPKGLRGGGEGTPERVCGVAEGVPWKAVTGSMAGRYGRVAEREAWRRGAGGASLWRRAGGGYRMRSTEPVVFWYDAGR